MKASLLAASPADELEAKDRELEDLKQRLSQASERSDELEAKARAAGGGASTAEMQDLEAKLCDDHIINSAGPRRNSRRCGTRGVVESGSSGPRGVRMSGEGGSRGEAGRRGTRRDEGGL